MVKLKLSNMELSRVKIVRKMSEIYEKQQVITISIDLISTA